MKTDPATPANRERGIKPISQQEKELTESLDFLVENVKMHSEKWLKKAESYPLPAMGGAEP